jgi:hypothetical protein
MIESTETTSVGSAVGVAGGAAISGFDAGDGVGIGFCFSCAVVELGRQRIMDKVVRKVIVINLSFMRISSNEFSLCRLRLKHAALSSGKVQRTFSAVTFGALQVWMLRTIQSW